jgi:hypothetical protein
VAARAVNCSQPSVAYSMCRRACWQVMSACLRMPAAGLCILGRGDLVSSISNSSLCQQQADHCHVPVECCDVEGSRSVLQQEAPHETVAAAAAAEGAMWGACYRRRQWVSRAQRACCMGQQVDDCRSGRTVLSRLRGAGLKVGLKPSDCRGAQQIAFS